ncbi:MAG TPA: hypothetical protein VK509_17805 [Polyangiales bacterium]|nr:hypothetical protein [Polyangiales bacterium]
MDLRAVRASALGIAALCAALAACGARSMLDPGDELAAGRTPATGASGSAGAADAHAGAGGHDAPGQAGGVGRDPAAGASAAGASGTSARADAGDASAGRSDRDAGALLDAAAPDAALRPALPWRGKAEAFCPDVAGSASLDVWSDARGVFVLVGDEQHPRILANDGGAWRVEAELAAGQGLRLSGFDGGPLVVQSSVLCGLRMVSGGVETCSAAVNGSTGFFALGPKQAYAGSGRNVLRFDGALWTQHKAAAAHVFSIWADDGTLAIGSAEGLYAIDPAGELLEQGLAASRYGSIWGGESGQLWAGSSAGLWFRASERDAWELLYGADATCDRVEHTWGSGDSLFFASNHMLTVQDARGLRTIAEWPCDRGVELTGLWGISPHEVFVALRETSGAGECSGASLLWYDGKQLRELDGTPPRSAVLRSEQTPE